MLRSRMQFNPDLYIDGGEARLSEGNMCTSPLFTTKAEYDCPLPWHVLHVRPNCEKKTSVFLAARGFETFVPARKYLAASTRKQVEAPLFPGYVFCGFNPLNLAPILSAPGVVRILSRDHKPEPIPKAEIFALQSLVRVHSAMESGPLYTIGEPIRITAGSLTGVEGYIVQDGGRSRLVVAIPILNRSVLAEVDRNLIDSIEPRVIPLHPSVLGGPKIPASSVGIDSSIRIRRASSAR